MNIHSPSFTTTSRLEVKIEQYQYIAKDNIPKNLVGFITDNVRDCVCGLISSDQGFVFFHFYRRDDPEDLKQRIEKDFKNSTCIKISLFGGNFVNTFFPWEVTERELHFLPQDKKSEYCGIEAMKLIQESEKEPLKVVYTVDLSKFGLELLQLVGQCQKNLKDNGFFEYDLDLLNTKLKEKQFQVFAFEDRSHFKVQRFEDFIGYQSLSKVLYAISEITLSDKSNLKHHYCYPSKLVIADFDGSCSAHVSEHPGFGLLNWNYEIAKDVNDVVLHKIKYADHFIDNRLLES